MRFAPKTETQIQEKRDAALGVWPKGIYDFEVTHAIDTVSKTGNEMIEMHLRVYNPDGESKVIRDYLLEAMAHKLRHAAEACGVLEDYERGTIVAEKLIGRSGRCRLDIEKDRSGNNYPDKNRIMDYEKPRPGIGATRPAAASRAKAPAGDIDDDIPF